MLGLLVPMNCICRIFGGHSVHFGKFLMLTFSKGYSSHSFHPISAKRYGKYDNQWGIQAVVDLPNFKFL